MRDSKRHKSSPSQAEMRRKLGPTAERTTLASSPGRSTWSPVVVGDDGSLHAELVRALALPLPMHSTSGAWKE